MCSHPPQLSPYKDTYATFSFPEQEQPVPYSTSIGPNRKQNLPHCFMSFLDLRINLSIHLSIYLSIYHLPIYLSSNYLICLPSQQAGWSGCLTLGTHVGLSKTRKCVMAAFSKLHIKGCRVTAHLHYLGQWCGALSCLHLLWSLRGTQLFLVLPFNWTGWFNIIQSPISKMHFEYKFQHLKLPPWAPIKSILAAAWFYQPFGRLDLKQQVRLKLLRRDGTKALGKVSMLFIM